MVEKVAFNQSLLHGMKEHTKHALRCPSHFILGRPFALVWTLYAATFATSNVSDTITRTFNKALVGTVVFINTTIINVPLGILKDVHFAKIFSASTSPAVKTIPDVRPGHGVPKVAAATFLIRDAITIFGSFTMAPVLANMVPDSLSSSPHTKALISQLTVPAMSQFFATPVHLLGLDQYARPHGVSWGGRAKQVRRDILSATIMRSLRLIPAFGVGGIVNMEARQRLRAIGWA